MCNNMAPSLLSPLLLFPLFEDKLSLCILDRPEHPEVERIGMQTQTPFWLLSASGLTRGFLPLAQDLFVNI